MENSNNVKIVRKMAKFISLDTKTIKIRKAQIFIEQLF